MSTDEDDSANQQGDIQNVKAPSTISTLFLKSVHTSFQFSFLSSGSKKDTNRADGASLSFQDLFAAIEVKEDMLSAPCVLDDLILGGEAHRLNVSWDRKLRQLIFATCRTATAVPQTPRKWRALTCTGNQQLWEQDVLLEKEANMLLPNQGSKRCFLGDSPSHEVRHADFTKMSSTMISLADTALRNMICDKPIRTAAGIKTIFAPSFVRLADLAPSIFSPGYSQDLVQRAPYIPAIARFLSSFLVLTNSPHRVDTRHHPLRHFPNATRQASDPQSCGLAEDEKLKEDLKANLWKTMVTNLRNKDSARRLKPLQTLDFESTAPADYTSNEKLENAFDKVPFLGPGHTSDTMDEAKRHNLPAGSEVNNEWSDLFPSDILFDRFDASLHAESGLHGGFEDTTCGQGEGGAEVANGEYPVPYIDSQVHWHFGTEAFRPLHISEEIKPGDSHRQRAQMRESTASAQSRFASGNEVGYRAAYAAELSDHSAYSHCMRAGAGGNCTKSHPPSPQGVSQDIRAHPAQIADCQEVARAVPISDRGGLVKNSIKLKNRQEEILSPAVCHHPVDATFLEDQDFAMLDSAPADPCQPISEIIPGERLSWHLWNRGTRVIASTTASHIIDMQSYHSDCDMLFLSEKGTINSLTGRSEGSLDNNVPSPMTPETSGEMSPPMRMMKTSPSPLRDAFSFFPPARADGVELEKPNLPAPLKMPLPLRQGQNNVRLTSSSLPTFSLSERERPRIPTPHPEFENSEMRRLARDGRAETLAEEQLSRLEQGLEIRWNGQGAWGLKRVEEHGDEMLL